MAELPILPTLSGCANRAALHLDFDSRQSPKSFSLTTGEFGLQVYKFLKIIELPGRGYFLFCFSERKNLAQLNTLNSGLVTGMY